jgi:hypothetical protein
LFWKSSFTMRIRKGSFAFRPLGLPAIYRLVYVSCTFYGKPPTEIPPSTHKSNQAVFRSNPYFRSIREYYSLCLRNFLC